MNDLKQFGRRIYYFKKDSSFIFDTGEYSGYGYESMPTPEEDLVNYRELQNYTLGVDIDYVDLDYGAHKEDFINCIAFRINVETKEIEFTFKEETNEDRISEKDLRKIGNKGWVREEEYEFMVNGE
ncbi:hypothetical protein FOH38_05360 [Lysinibacillus fusiformis]|nr:hypothetical protein FOH38_05360 [Lysinibacillus fusiformis]